MKTKKPSAIVYGWGEFGTFELTSDVYYEENLLDKVVIYSSGRIAQIGTPNEIFQSSSNLDVDLHDLPPLTEPPPELVFP